MNSVVIKGTAELLLNDNVSSKVNPANKRPVLKYLGYLSLCPAIIQRHNAK